MSPTDPRGAALRRVAALAEDFRSDAARRFVGGSESAARDQERLTDLANHLAANLRAWRGTLNTLEASLEHENGLERAGRLLIEAVFDEALSPSAARFLAASLDLALIGS